MTFDEWWDSDNLTQTNPYRDDSPVYWAWEGWQAGVYQHQRLLEENCRLLRQEISELESSPMSEEALDILRNENARLRLAIQRALDDSESGNGWGPDVTVCQYLRDALQRTADRKKGKI